MDMMDRPRREPGLKFCVERINFGSGEPLERTIAERRDNVQPQQLFVPLQGPRVHAPAARLLCIATALQCDPAINPGRECELTRRNMLAVISALDQSPQFLPSFADRPVKASGKPLAMDAPAQSP